MAKKEPTFSAKQLIESIQFMNYKDLVQSVVKHDERITIKEAKSRVNKYLKGKVM